MHFRFLHIADIHLGNKQYNQSFRADDFARAFKDVIVRAIDEKVDFVLIAGDLFHKRAIDAITLENAYRWLDRLKQAGIPCVAIEGNHEMAYYGEEGSWLGFLRMRGLIILLQARFEDGLACFDELKNGRGGWVDPIPGVRVYGLGYKGAGAPVAVERCVLALDALPPEARAGIEFTIFAAHTGVLGELAGDAVSPTLPQWLAMRPHADYVALGHIHKPFEKDDWLFNPGSLETCASNEWAWGDRAALLVDVDTAMPQGPQRTRITRIAPQRRPFARFSFKADLHNTPDSLLAECASEFARRRRDMGKLTPHTMPVVDIVIDGVLTFDPSLLNLRDVEVLATQSLEAAFVQVKNFTIRRQLTVNGEDEVMDGQEQPREIVEKRVLEQLLRDDNRFSDHSDAWADIAVTLKNMALVPEPPERILSELDTRMTAISTSRAAA